MSTATLTRSSAPRVNLLPPEIGQARTLRRLQFGLGAGVLTAVGAIVVLYVLALGDVSSATNSLDATRAQGTAIQTESAKYADVPAAIAKVDAAAAQRSQAMNQEIRWSYVLNDMSLRIPSKVWLTNVTATESVDGAVATATTPGGYPEAGVGTVLFTGLAYGHNDVARWLEVLSGEKGFSQAYFANSTEDSTKINPSGGKVVNFTSQVTVTADALSHRYEPKAAN